MNLSEGAWAKCPPEAVAQTCLVALFESPEDREQLDRMDRQLHAALAKSPRSEALLAAQGHLRSMQGRYADAVAIYRNALQRNQRDALAMNNLAWLLALQGRDPRRPSS